MLPYILIQYSLSLCDFTNNENWLCVYTSLGLPRWCIGKESAYQWRKHKIRGIDPWVRIIPWSRKSQPTPVFLPGIFLDRRAWWVPTVQGSQKVGHDWATDCNTHIHLVLIQYSEKKKSKPWHLGAGLALTGRYWHPPTDYKPFHS